MINRNIACAIKKKAQPPINGSPHDVGNDISIIIASIIPMIKPTNEAFFHSI